VPAVPLLTKNVHRGRAGIDKAGPGGLSVPGLNDMLRVRYAAFRRLGRRCCAQSAKGVAAALIERLEQQLQDASQS
jgi:hypothetical protein